MGDDGAAHARLPEAANVVLDAGYGGGAVRLGAEEGLDVVGHLHEAFGIRFHEYTTWLVPRAKPISAMPQSRAMRMARPVGAEIAASSGTPTVAAFCTISLLARLVMIAKPSWEERLPCAMAPISLSSALWRPRSSRTSSSVPSGRPQAAAVTAAGEGVQALALVEGVERGVDGGMADGACRLHLGQRAQHLLEALGAAQPAAGAAGEVAPPRLQRHEALRRDRHPHLDAARGGVHLDVAHLARRLHDALGQREAQAEFLQVHRARQHHDVRDVVVHQRDRRLLGDGIVDLRQGAFAPALPAAVEGFGHSDLRRKKRNLFFRKAA